MKQIHTLLNALLLAILACHPLRGGDDWPQFRGPNCTGISEGTKALPVRFSPEENLCWKEKIGDGVGGAVVAAGRVFVTGMTADETVSLFAFDAETGMQLWRRDWQTGPVASVHKTNSKASATPAADADRVYFYFPTLGLLAMDAQTGADAWQYKMPNPFFVLKWGAGVSPVLYRDLVLFCQDDDLNPAFYALEKASGALRWKDERFDMALNYTHPVICTTDGRDEVVVAGTGLLVGYDPETGRRRWFARVLLFNTKTTPVVHDGVIYVSAQSGSTATSHLGVFDHNEKSGNNDGKVDKAEIQRFFGKQPIPEGYFKSTFDRGDLNGDGFLEGHELDIAFMHPENFAGADYTPTGKAGGGQFIMAVRGGGTGDVTTTHVLWKHNTKHTDHVVSPFVSDGRILIVKPGGITTVFDTIRGEPLREPKRLSRAGGYFASPVCGDGKIYLAGENSEVTVLKNSDEYEELAVNDLGESIIATPAIAGGRIYVRTRTQLLCFDVPPAETSR
jgi:outer membrane protein assembly factor BamB